MTPEFGPCRLWKVAKSEGHFCSPQRWGRILPMAAMDLSSRSIGGEAAVGRHHLRVASLPKINKVSKGRNMISCHSACRKIADKIWRIEVHPLDENYLKLGWRLK